MLIYAANGELGDALAERIRSMTKEVEVGDEFNGKVVKTTTFGAFVELSKGTDGLLHISNIAPGQRVDTVEEVLNKGDEIKVRVVEVDRERGRIGLRLADDPDIAGKSVEELARRCGRGDGGGPRGDRGGDRGATARGGDRRRPRPRLRPPAPRRDRDPERGCVRGADAPPHRAGLGRAGRDGVAWTPSDPSALGFWIGTGSGAEAEPRGRPVAPDRAHAVPRDRHATRRWRSTSSSTPWAPS